MYDFDNTEKKRTYPQFDDNDNDNENTNRKNTIGQFERVDRVTNKQSNNTESSKALREWLRTHPHQ